MYDIRSTAARAKGVNVGGDRVSREGPGEAHENGSGLHDFDRLWAWTIVTQWRI